MYSRETKLKSDSLIIPMDKIETVFGHSLILLSLTQFYYIIEMIINHSQM